LGNYADKKFAKLKDKDYFVTLKSNITYQNNRLFYLKGMDIFTNSYISHALGP
jgi:hypothetical protein